MLRSVHAIFPVLGLALAMGYAAPCATASSSAIDPFAAGETDALPSPDGEYVAVRRSGDTGLRLVIVDMESGRELELPGFLPMTELPRWAPTGGRLAVALKVGRRTEVFVLELDREDGPRLLRLTFEGGGAPRWIVGGKRLIYEANDGRGGTVLLERDVRGTGPAQPFWEQDESPQPPPRGPLA
jgi:hypothetical protein